MKLSIPKLIVPLDLAEYNPELKGQSLYVWVDPPRKVFQQYDQLTLDAEEEEARKIAADLATVAGPPENKKLNLVETFKAAWSSLFNARVKRSERRSEGTDRRILSWYAEIWSQDPAHPWTLDELIELEDMNPALLGWLMAQTWVLMAENRDRKKKSIASAVRKIAQQQGST